MERIRIDRRAAGRRARRELRRAEARAAGDAALRYQAGGPGGDDLLARIDAVLAAAGDDPAGRTS